MEALAELELAEPWVGDDKLALASLHWSRASLAGKLQELEVALESYKTALSLYEKHGSEAIIATLTFEFAELLVRENRRPELLELTAGSARWLAEARRNRKIREALEDLLALTVMKELDIGTLSRLRESLNGEALAPGHIRKKTQPPGGYSGPYSGASPVASLLFGGESAGVSAG